MSSDPVFDAQPSLPASPPDVLAQILPSPPRTMAATPATNGGSFRRRRFGETDVASNTNGGSRSLRQVDGALANFVPLAVVDDAEHTLTTGTSSAESETTLSTTTLHSSVVSGRTPIAQFGTLIAMLDAVAAASGDDRAEDNDDNRGGGGSDGAERAREPQDRPRGIAATTAATTTTAPRTPVHAPLPPRQHARTPSSPSQHSQHYSRNTSSLRPTMTPSGSLRGGDNNNINNDALQHVRCPVCLDVFDGPVALRKCGHHVCKSHVLDLAACHEQNDAAACPRGVAAADRFFIRCPKCRVDSVVEGGVEALKVNAEMQSLVHALVHLSTMTNATPAPPPASRQLGMTSSMLATPSLKRVNSGLSSNDDDRDDRNVLDVHDDSGEISQIDDADDDNNSSAEGVAQNKRGRRQRGSHNQGSSGGDGHRHDSDNETSYGSGADSGPDEPGTARSRASSSSRRRVTFLLSGAPNSESKQRRTRGADDAGDDAGPRTSRRANQRRDPASSSSSPPAPATATTTGATPSTARAAAAAAAGTDDRQLGVLEHRLAEERRRAADEHARAVRLKVEEFKRQRAEEIRRRHADEAAALSATLGVCSEDGVDDREDDDREMNAPATQRGGAPTDDHDRAHHPRDDAADAIVEHHLAKIRAEQLRRKQQRREQREREVRDGIADWLRRAEETKEMIARAREAPNSGLASVAGDVAAMSREAMRAMAEQRIPHDRLPVVAAKLQQQQQVPEAGGVGGGGGVGGDGAATAHQMMSWMLARRRDSSDTATTTATSNRIMINHDVEVEVAMLRQDRLALRERDDELSKAEMAELAELRARNLINQFRVRDAQRPKAWNPSVGSPGGLPRPMTTSSSSVTSAPPSSIFDVPLPPPVPAYVPKLLRRVPIPEGVAVV